DGLLDLDARSVDEDVEPSFVRGYPCHCRFGLVLRGDVEAHIARSVLRRGIQTAGIREVACIDDRTLFDESRTDRPPDATPAASDEGDLSSEPVAHGPHLFTDCGADRRPRWNAGPTDRP